MKSAEQRDAVVARVQEAHQKYPAFDSLPVGGKRGIEKSRLISWPIEDPEDGAAYTRALYEISYRGGVPIGRVNARGEEPAEIIGEIPPEEE